MSKLRWILGLSDGASAEEETKAVEQLKEQIATLEEDNKKLKDELAELKKELKAYKDADEQEKKQEKDKQKEEAKELIDAAVRDGRIDASARDAYVSLFDLDFASTKIALSALPARKPISGRLGDEVNLGDEGSAWERAMARAREKFNN